MRRDRKIGVLLSAVVLFLSFVTIPSVNTKNTNSLRKRTGVTAIKINKVKVKRYYDEFKLTLDLLIKDGESEHFKEALEAAAADFYFIHNKSGKEDIKPALQKLAEEYSIYTTDWVKRAMETADFEQQQKVKRMLAAALKPVDFEQTYAVIVAGGLASRMYPYNKLLNRFGDNEGNLLEETIWRMAQMLSAENIYIATTEELRPQIAEIAEKYGIPNKNIITDEPAGGVDTAAIFSYMCLKVELDHPDQDDQMVMITPADSYVRKSDIDKFKADFTEAVYIASNGSVFATIGIDPKGEPSTEFGHLSPIPEQETFFKGVSQIAFKEKPKTTTDSQKIVDAGGLFNAGIIVTKISTMDKAMKYFAPDYFEGLQKIKNSNGDSKVIKEIMAQWNGWKTNTHPQRGSNISMDFVLLEPLAILQANSKNLERVRAKAKKDGTKISFDDKIPLVTIVSVPGTFSWDDIGDFSKVHKMETKRGNKDDHGNAFKGEPGTAVFEETRGSLVWTEGLDMKIVLKGVENLAVVNDPVHKTTVIAPLNNPKAVKKLRGKVAKGEFSRFLQEGLEERQYMRNYYVSDYREGFDYEGRGFVSADKTQNIDIVSDKNLIAVTSVQGLTIIQFGNALYVYGPEYKYEAEQIGSIVKGILNGRLKDGIDWREFVDEDLKLPTELALLEMAGRGDDLGTMVFKDEIDTFNKGGVFLLVPYKQEKPWGKGGIGEYWFSSVDPEKGSAVKIGNTELPLAAVVDKEPVLLKYPRERIGDLSLQVHDTKNEIWIVTTEGTVALGFNQEKIDAFKESFGDKWENMLREDFRDILLAYNANVKELAQLVKDAGFEDLLEEKKDILLAVNKLLNEKDKGLDRRIIDFNKMKKIDELFDELKNLEKTLNSFLNIIEVKPGDVVSVPAGTLHALLHGTEVIEPQIFGKTRRGADGTRLPVRMKKGDEQKAVEVMKVVSGEVATAFPSPEKGVDIIGEFPGLTVERISLVSPAPKEYETPAQQTKIIPDIAAMSSRKITEYNSNTQNSINGYHILSVVSGKVRIITENNEIIIGSPKKPVYLKNAQYEIIPITKEAVVIKNYAPVPKWWPADMPVPVFLDELPEFAKYGTSGMRAHNDVLTDLEVYILTKGYINYLLKKGIVKNGDEFPIAGDLRISTDRIMQAKARAVRDIGLVPVHGGKVPTPALAYYAMYFDDMLANACSMTTGSHIAWDKNGIKQYKPDGEVLKHEEPEILAHIMAVREEEYVKSEDETVFDSKGMFKEKADALGESKEQEVEDFFFERNMVFKHSPSYKESKTKDKTIVVWKQTSVGGALLVKMAREFGFKIVEAAEEDEEQFLGERKGGFRQIDTETITEDHEAFFVYLAEKYKAFAVLSADGDADRPIIADETGRFIMGDLVDLISAKVLGADFISMPVSCNSGTKAYAEKYGIEMEMTKIGSVYPIKAGLEAVKRGKKKAIVYERNGGLILISDVQLYGQEIKALPTRDAFLPIWTYLFYSLDNGMKISEPVEGFPYAVSGAIKFPMAQGIALTDNMVPSNKDIFQVWFDVEGDIKVSYKEDQNKKESLADERDKEEALAIRAFLEQYFTKVEGYGKIVSLNFMDAPRIFFDNNRSVHIRQSRNDDDLKNYNEDPESVAAVRAVRRDVLDKKIPLIIKAIENKKNLQPDFEKAKLTPQIEESI